MRYPPSRQKAETIIAAYEDCHGAGRRCSCRDCKARGEVQYRRLPCGYCYRRAKEIISSGRR